MMPIVVWVPTPSLLRRNAHQDSKTPIHWPKAANFSETATHAIKFGPTGLSSIGSLTVRNLGHGVRIIITCDKVKETFDTI